MKIKPHKIIVPGLGIKVAEQLRVTSEADNLVDAVTFRASLLDSDGVDLLSTLCSLDASNYGTWDATSDGAHTICAKAIGLTPA